MAYEVIWSKNFSESFIQNINYLETNWGIIQLNEFVDIVDNSIFNISEFPFIGEEVSNEQNLRSIVISKIHTIFYRFDNTKIILLGLYDNRSNPENKLKQ